MQKNYKRMSYQEFLKYIDKICEHLSDYINEKKIKIDYICPVLRSGAVPAVYVCLAKEYGSCDFEDITIYEDSACYYNGKNGFSEEKCKALNVKYFSLLFPCEDLKMELEHPDDLEENIFF